MRNNKIQSKIQNKVYYNYRYFLPYSPEWGSSEFCNQRLKELLDFCRDAKIDAVQFFVNTLPGTYYMPAHNAQEQVHWAKWMKETVAPSLGENGISYQLNFQMLLGGISHRLDMRDEYDWGFLVNQYGKETLGCACPIDTDFRRIMGHMLRLWADTQPDAIWIDDDFRMHNHGLGGPEDMDTYCYCERHLDEFSEFAGKRYSREELVAKILRPGEPSQVRLQWMEFLGRTMTDTADWIRREVQGVSPETRMALMTSCPDVHSGEGRDWKKCLQALCGDYIPKTRPMCGVYTGTTVPIKRNACTYKYISQSMNTLEHIFGVDGVEFGPELENTVFTTWCKARSHSEYVLILSQLMGASEITLSLNDLDGGEISQEPTNVEMLHDCKPMLQTIADLNLKYWKKEGVVFLNDPKSAAKVQLKDGAIMQDLGLLRQWEDTLLQCGISAYHDFTDEAVESGNVVVLEEYTAWIPSDEQMEKLLAGGLLLDSGAAEVLQKRGFGEYLGVKVGERADYAVMSEIYRQGVFEECQAVRVPHRRYNWHEMELNGATLVTESIDPKGRLHVGNTIFENSLSGRVAIYNHIGEPLKGTFGNHVRLDWLKRTLRWLSRERFSVLPQLPHHGLFIVRSNGKELLFSLANLGTDIMEELTLTIYGKNEITDVEVLDANGKWIKAKVKIVPEDTNGYNLILNNKLNIFEWLIVKLSKGENNV